MIRRCRRRGLLWAHLVLALLALAGVGMTCAPASASVLAPHDSPTVDAGQSLGLLDSTCDPGEGERSCPCPDVPALAEALLAPPPVTPQRLAVSSFPLPVLHGTAPLPPVPIAG